MSKTQSAARIDAAQDPESKRAARQLAARRRRRYIPLILSAAVFLAVVLLAVFAHVISPHDPLKQDVLQRLKPPSWLPGGSEGHPLGTDALGRDILSRTVYGARISLTVGLLSVVVGGAIGITLGLLAGYFRGTVDLVLGRIADIQQALPFIVLVLALVAAVGASLTNLILVLGIGSWVFFYRIVRGATQAVRELTYVEAARATGCPHSRIVWRYVLPNVMSAAIITVTLFVPQVILYEAALSFLGLGVPPPTPSWGSIIADGRAYVEIAWWISVFPGLFLMGTVLAVNMLGEWLRDYYDPLRRGR
jgi:ABC-type dipeptide/oligopeptide/nickel transport system permease subunit